MDYVLGRLVDAGYCKLKELNAWEYSWAEIWQMHDMLDLKAWLEFRHHQEAERATQ